MRTPGGKTPSWPSCSFWVYLGRGKPFAQFICSSLKSSVSVAAHPSPADSSRAIRTDKELAARRRLQTSAHPFRSDGIHLAIEKDYVDVSPCPEFERMP